MNSFLNTLQMLVSMAGLLVTLVVLFWIVYAFGKLAVAFEKMIKAIEQPHIHVHVPPATASEAAEEKDTAPCDFGARCNYCNAMLPAYPSSSIVKFETTILVFKCGQCGKETEIDPQAK